MTLGSLFDGISGFPLAASWCGIETKWVSEIDPYCLKRSKKIFPNAIQYGNIKELYNPEPTDIICGGDPCQPNSVAGLGKGKEDVRYLWPQMFRIVREVQPTWVINENVSGSIANGILDIKINDLESIGYTCQSYCIPAESVGALHQRERVWLIAHNPNGYASSRDIREIQKQSNREGIQERDKIQHTWESVDLRDSNSYANIERFKEQYSSPKSGVLQKGVSRHFGFGTDPHGNIPRDIIESGIIRMLNGLPEGLDYADRNKRLKALGNSIVPQVAYEIFKAIKEIEDSF
jgi:DNA (cytosine-5)-methyltransferase 1